MYKGGILGEYSRGGSSMGRMFGKYLLPALGLAAIAMCAPQAKAGSIDFACGDMTDPCSGTVTSSGGLAFTGSGIALGSSFDSNTYTASFTTNAAGMGTITITGGGNSLSGNIVGTTNDGSFGGDQTILLDVDWTSLSSGIRAALGGNVGIGQSTITFAVMGGNSVESADLHINSTTSPTPEPASLLLLGTGLLGMGAVVRRRLFS
jgi:hypothetical protein